MKNPLDQHFFHANVAKVSMNFLFLFAANDINAWRLNRIDETESDETSV